MKVDENALEILNSCMCVCENHAKKLYHAILETKDHVPFTAESLEKLSAVDAAFLEVVTSRFAEAYLSIEFVQHVAALLCECIKTIFQQVAEELSHDNKEFCASITCTIN